MKAAKRAPIEQCIVVDDDPVIRGILRSTLAGIGLGVHLAMAGEEAIAMAARLKTGLFMLDLQMPGINGLDICRHLRSLPRHAETPIIVLTGHDSPRTREAAFAAGATMFLVKPFKPSALLQALAPLLQGSATGPTISGSDTPLPSRDIWTETDPEYRNQLWGRQDALRAAASRARNDNDLGLD